MMKIKVEIDFDETSQAVNTVGDAFSYLIGVVYKFVDSGEPFQVRQPPEPFIDFYGNKIGSWHITNGSQTSGLEPGNGLNEPIISPEQRRIHELEVEVDKLRHSGGV